MTELEKIKSDIAQLVIRIDELQNKSNEDVFIFNKEQLLKYTMNILEQNLETVKTQVKNIEFDDECVELNLDGGYRGRYEIDIDIDNGALQQTVINEIDELEVTEENTEPFMIDALGNIGYFEKKDYEEKLHTTT
jgi:hypothetical protein